MNKPVSYLQTDPKWKNADYSAEGEKTTIGASGCGPTAMAMVLATWADPAVTPLTECRWALAHGYKAPHQGTYYGYFEPAARRYGLDCRRLNTVSAYGKPGSPVHETARAAIERGDLVIACMGPGLWTRSGHYVLVWDIAGNVVRINDPASTNPARIMGNYAVFKQQVKYYWTIHKEGNMSNFEIEKLIEEKIRAAVPEIVLAVMDRMPKPVVYNTLEEVPAWGRAAVEKRLASIKGDGTGLGISHDLLRVWVIQDRAQENGMD